MCIDAIKAELIRFFSDLHYDLLHRLKPFGDHLVTLGWYLKWVFKESQQMFYFIPFPLVNRESRVSKLSVQKWFSEGQQGLFVRNPSLVSLSLSLLRVWDPYWVTCGLRSCTRHWGTIDYVYLGHNNKKVLYIHIYCSWWCVLSVLNNIMGSVEKFNKMTLFIFSIVCNILLPEMVINYATKTS